MNYRDPAAYWERRLRAHFNLCGTGHFFLGPRYNERLYGVRRAALERALERAEETLTGKRVLEIGCGTGFYTKLCAERHVASYLGVDLTAASIESLRVQYPTLQFLQADIGADDFPLDMRFDLALIADVLFHIVEPARFHRALANVGRCLRPNGLLILSDVLSVQTVRVADHVYVRSFDEYCSALCRCGFDVCFTEPIFGVLHPPTPMQGTSLAWQTYARFWQFGLMRIARQSWFDRRVPRVLEMVDRHFVVPRASVATPNSKWLIARKRAD